MATATKWEPAPRDVKPKLTAKQKEEQAAKRYKELMEELAGQSSYTEIQNKLISREITPDDYDEMLQEDGAKTQSSVAMGTYMTLAFKQMDYWGEERSGDIACMSCQ